MYLCPALITAHETLNPTRYKESGIAQEAYAEALLKDFDVCFQNVAYLYLPGADFRSRMTPKTEASTVDKVVQNEKAFQGSVPKVASAHAHFGLAKESYFQISHEKRQ